MTNQEIAQRIADIQWQMYDFYGIDSLPAADSNCANHEGLLKEMDTWMADQLRKTSWFDLIDQQAILCADEDYNAHFIAEVATNECGFGTLYEVHDGEN
jgi:hypothetical protein